MFINACTSDTENEGQVEKVDFKVVWKKNTYDVSFPLDDRVDKLKEHINTLCGGQPMVIVIYEIILKNRYSSSHDEADV